jgi:hypothetical protein
MADYYEAINLTHFNITQGVISEQKILEAMPVDEYYATINTFLAVQEQRKADLEKLKNQNHE